MGTRRKPLGAGTRTNKKLNPHMTPRARLSKAPETFRPRKAIEKF